MRPNERVPRRGLPPLGSSRDPMPPEDVPDRLVTEGVPQIGQGAGNPVISPGAILLGQPYDERLPSRGRPRPSGIPPVPGPVTLLGDELAVPGEDRLRPDDGGDLLQRLPPELLPKRGIA